MVLPCFQFLLQVIGFLIAGHICWFFDTGQ